MDNKKHRIYSLAMEELALALGLVGQPGVANQLLTAGKIKIHPDEMDVRLDSAIHSMLARGLSKIDPQGKAVLDEQLQEAIGMITNFDKIISLSLVIQKKKVDSTIRLDKKGRFLVQTISPDGVYVLEYIARQAEINTYLVEIMGTNPKLKKDIATKELPMTIKMLADIVEQKEALQVATILTRSGWDDLSAKTLANDFQKEILRGMILLTKSGSNATQQDMDAAERKSIFFLNSSEHLWLFHLPGTDIDATGTADLVTTQDATTSINAFLQ